MVTPLCDLAIKYGTDKGITHSYTPFYYELFKDKPIKKVLEIGIGDAIYRKRLKHGATLGASLKMWRDFFPQAQVYGADIDPDTMFEDERIKTFVCDETKEPDIKALIQKTGSDLDIVIDDGLHTESAQIFLCKILMPLLPKNVVYIIEDVRGGRQVMHALKEYECYMAPIADVPHAQKLKNKIIVVKHK